MVGWATRTLLTVGAFAAIAVQAQAAMLTTSGAGTQVNSGNGFRPVAHVAKVKPGDTIIVGPQAGAVLTFAAGCSVSIKPGRMFHVGPKAPCTSSAKRAELYKKFGKPMGAGQPPGAPPVPAPGAGLGGGLAAAGSTIGMAASIAATVTVFSVIGYKAANPASP